MEPTPAVISYGAGAEKGAALDTISASAATARGPRPIIPTAYINHGLPTLILSAEESPGLFREFCATSPAADFFRSLQQRIKTSSGDGALDLAEAPPAAILVVSAHWEEETVAVQSSPRPPMYYDFGGFPEKCYRIKYAAPGSPAVARRVVSLLAAAGIPAREDATRGYDHGAFCPLMLAFPAANVPVLQLSLHASLDPATHLRIGAALAPLRAEGVLVLGSGSLTHNQRIFGSPAGLAAAAAGSRTPEPRQAAFVAWVHTTLADPSVALAERVRRLVHVAAAAPHFRAAHPREEHFIPLLVAWAAAAPAPAEIGPLVDAALKAGPTADAAAAAAGLRLDALAEAGAQRDGSPTTTRICDAWVVHGLASFGCYSFC